MQSEPLGTQLDHALPVYTGTETVHAKRVSGRYRQRKWLAAGLWLGFFLLPYWRWHQQQAILLDIDAGHFRFFSLSLYPSDVWLLAFVLIAAATLLLFVAAVGGRLFCGFSCFQTVWTDAFTWLENRIEGSPQQRRELDAAPWSLRKISLKASKHSAWLLLALLTGISFVAWFTDVYQLWADVFTAQAALPAWIFIGLIASITYVFAGFMREQVCFWLCPYSRFQSMMYSQHTILPYYQPQRGEPRGKLERRSTQEAQQGDCVDCKLCVAVCPTGIDIRDGQQIGCISCGLCIDACDQVMAKLDKPLKLIQYTNAAATPKAWGKALRQPLAWIALSIALLSLLMLAHGLSQVSSAELNILPDRQPMFTQPDPEHVRNLYHLRLLNKSNQPQSLHLQVQGLAGAKLLGETSFELEPQQMLHGSFQVESPSAALKPSNALSFELQNQSGEVLAEHQSVFLAPR